MLKSDNLEDRILIIVSATEEVMKLLNQPWDGNHKWYSHGLYIRGEEDPSKNLGVVIVSGKMFRLTTRWIGVVQKDKTGDTNWITYPILYTDNSL